MFKAYSFVFFALFAIGGIASVSDSPNTNISNTDSLATVHVDKIDTGACRQRTKILC